MSVKFQIGKEVTTMENTGWHLIREKAWIPSSSGGILQFQIRFLCEKALRDRTPGRYRKLSIETYIKEKHHRVLCRVCIDAIKSHYKK